MCLRTNSSYSPRRLTSSIAVTKRRRSALVRVLTFLRVYTMVVTAPLRTVLSCAGPPPAHAARPAVHAAHAPELLGRAQLLDGRADRRQRCRIRLVVVHH